MEPPEHKDRPPIGLHLREECGCDFIVVILLLILLSWFGEAQGFPHYFAGGLLVGLAVRFVTESLRWRYLMTESDQPVQISLAGLCVLTLLLAALLGINLHVFSMDRLSATIGLIVVDALVAKGIGQWLLAAWERRTVTSKRNDEDV